MCQHLCWFGGPAWAPIAHLKRYGIDSDLSSERMVTLRFIVRSWSIQILRTRFDYQQLVQAQEFDLVVSIPCTPGSIGEVHDFAADRRVNAKLLVFINRQHVSGYASQSLEAISTILSCEIEYYPDETETKIIEERTLLEAQKIREMKYLLAGRY